MRWVGEGGSEGRRIGRSVRTMFRSQFQPMIRERTKKAGKESNFWS